MIGWPKQVNRTLAYANVSECANIDSFCDLDVFITCILIKIKQSLVVVGGGQ